MSLYLKCACGAVHDDWPSRDGKSSLCTDCWEKECDEDWWETVRLLEEA